MCQNTVLASTIISPMDIPIVVYDIWKDPEERKDISRSDPYTTQYMVKAFNRHWKNHRKQFDFSLSCADRRRLREMPRELCDRRTSQLNSNLLNRSISSDIPCVFEQPFIDDDDPRPCGDFDEPVKLTDVFQAFVIQKVRNVVVVVLGGVVSIACFIAFLCCCRRRVAKKEKAE